MNLNETMLTRKLYKQLGIMPIVVIEADIYSFLNVIMLKCITKNIIIKIKENILFSNFLLLRKYYYTMENSF